jgi:hypothetical protein
VDGHNARRCYKNKELESSSAVTELESVGLLGRRIAHDFNNMLTAINGYSELTLRKLKKMTRSAHTSKKLKKPVSALQTCTAQLLAFSRQQ